MCIGARLREARERRGTTLRQVAEFTRVPAQVLEMIERDDFSRLPGGIITKGYLRAFATAVGQNPEEIVGEYLRQYPPSTTFEQLRKAPAVETDEGRPLYELMMLLVFGMFAYALYAGFEAPTRAPGAPANARGMEPPRVAPNRTVAAQASVTAAEPDSQGLVLEIQPTGPCWVSARADGELVLRRLIAGGERVTVSAREHVVLRVGAPGKFTYRLNGADGRPIGEPGKPVTVTITDENYGAYQIGREGTLGKDSARRAT